MYRNAIVIVEDGKKIGLELMTLICFTGYFEIFFLLNVCVRQCSDMIEIFIDRLNDDHSESDGTAPAKRSKWGIPIHEILENNNFWGEECLDELDELGSSFVGKGRRKNDL